MANWKYYASAAIATMLMPANMALASTVISLPVAQYSSNQAFAYENSDGGASSVNTSQNTTGSISESYSHTYPANMFGNNPTVTVTGTASTSITMAPDPIITASTSQNIVIGPEGYGLQSQAIANYYYFASVVGQADVNVPIDLTYTESVTLTGQPSLGNSEAGASLGMFALIPSATYDIPVIPGESTVNFLGTKSVSGSLSYLSTSNTPFVVGGYVVSQMGAFTGSASVTLDPFLAIDPSFAAVDPNYLTDYSIVLSPGVGNAASGVPEPATWAMMLMGFGLFGYAMRKRPNLWHSACVFRDCLTG